MAWSRIAEPGKPEVARWVAGLGAGGGSRRARSGRALGVGDGYAARAAESIDLDAAVRVLGDSGSGSSSPATRSGRTGWTPSPTRRCACMCGGRADLGPALERSVAVVGSRAATAYGTRSLGRSARGWSARDATVVSGAAYGIDAAAHRGALAAGGRRSRCSPAGRPGLPAAATGTDRADREDRRRRQRGPGGRAPCAVPIPPRNRLIATMTLGTVVVEAGLRSGSLNTARHAREHHRHVAAVPGR